MYKIFTVRNSKLTAPMFPTKEKAESYIKHLKHLIEKKVKVDKTLDISFLLEVKAMRIRYIYNK